MDSVQEIDIDALGIWLLHKCDGARGDGTIAEIITQLLRSSLGYALYTDDTVQKALRLMMESNDVHIGLDVMNVVMALFTDDLARAYLNVLAYEHSCLHDPPFESTDSMLWYYRDWKITQLDTLHPPPSGESV
jgi:hypothetical protein